MTRIIADTEMMAQVATQAQQQAAHLNTTLQQLSSAVGRLNRWEGASHYQFNNDWSSISRQLHDAANEIDHLGHCLQTTANNFRATDEQCGAVWGGADSLYAALSAQAAALLAGIGGGLGAPGGDENALLKFLHDQGGNINTIFDVGGPGLGFLIGLNDRLNSPDSRGLLYDSVAEGFAEGLQGIRGVDKINAIVQLGGYLVVAGEGVIAPLLTNDPNLLATLNSSSDSLTTGLKNANLTPAYEAAGNVLTDVAIGGFTGHFDTLGSDTAKFAETTAQTLVGVAALPETVVFNAANYEVVAADDVVGALPISQGFKDTFHSGATAVASVASESAHNTQNFVSDVGWAAPKGAAFIWHRLFG